MRQPEVVQTKIVPLCPDMDTIDGQRRIAHTRYFQLVYPELKIVLCSAALDVPEGEMMSLNGFIAKGDGIGALLSKITEFQDYRIRGLQNSGESIRQLPLYSRSRTMLLLKP